MFLKIICHVARPTQARQLAGKTEAAAQIQPSVLGCIRPGLMWPHSSGVFHVDAPEFRVLAHRSD